MLLLQRAVQLGRLEVVQVLLERGVDPDARNEWGDTALHLAAAIRGDGSTGLTLFFHGVETSQSLLERNVTVPLIRLLLTRGADPTLRNRKGEAPLDVLHPQAPEEARSLLTGEAKP
jgi:ankyrin repeat protein